MPGKGVKIAPQILDVDHRVGYRLCAVDERGDTARLGRGNQAPHGKHRAERVGDMRAREQTGARAEQRLDRFDVHLAVRVHGRNPEPRAGLFADDLPWNDVGMMLEVGDEHLVAGHQQRPRIALRDQIDRFGRAAHENDLVARARIDEPHQPVARSLV